MDTLFLRLPATATETIQTVCFRQGHWQRLGSWAIDADLEQQWQSLKDLPVVLITKGDLFHQDQKVGQYSIQ